VKRRVYPLALATALLGGPAALAATPTVATPKRVAHVRIGDSERVVVSLLGNGYMRCARCGAGLTWLYEYRGVTGQGVAIRFEDGHVAAVIRLGVPTTKFVLK